MKFKYGLDKRCRIITWSVLGGLALVMGLLWFFSPGGYLSAWFLSITIAFMALCALSIPRNIRTTSDAVEIGCLIEITHIPYNHVKSVRRVERAELKPFIPVFASPGFFGYFGYWLDLRNWDFVKVYATSWQGLVIIEDIYEQRYLVSCDNPEALQREIENACKFLTPKKRPSKSRAKTQSQPPKSDPEKKQMSLF